MKIHFFIFSLSLSLILMNTSLAAQARQGTGPQANRTNSEDFSPALDFETYQRNIDDMFYIALMTNPSVDYGINSVIIDLNRKIADNPENPQPLISLGHVYRILGQPSEANRFYEKALEKDPRNFHLNLFSAVTTFQAEEFEKALARLDQAIAIHPADLYPQLARGRILMLLYRDGEAIEAFERALEIEPENRQAAFLLSLLYQKTGESEKAEQILKQLKERSPEDIFIHYHLGALALAQGNPQEAIESWSALFKKGIRDIQFLFNLSVAYLENKEAEKAEKILGHLHFFFPEEEAVELLLAEAYRQLGRLEEAERRYRFLLAEKPGYLMAYIGLAQVLDLQGKEAERDEILRQASTKAKRASQMRQEQELAEKTHEELLYELLDAEAANRDGKSE